MAWNEEESFYKLEVNIKAQINIKRELDRNTPRSTRVTQCLVRQWRHNQIYNIKSPNNKHINKK